MAVGLLLALVACLGQAPARAAEFTDDDVVKAIDAGRQYLLDFLKGGGRGGGGRSGEGGAGGSTAMALMTLAYMGEHPNRPEISSAMDYLLTAGDGEFGNKQAYVMPMRVMAFAYLLPRLSPSSDRHAAVRQKMTEDCMRFISGQSRQGGWRYTFPRDTYDFSNSQWPILAFREASLVGIEFPLDCLKRARDLYFQEQHPDGGWSYQDKNKAESYGSMSAGGTASIFILNDLLDPLSGCPCQNGRSGPIDAENRRREELALSWLAQHFTATTNPGKSSWHIYWLYSAERVGIAAGYKYFGEHDWYREGAAHLLQHGGASGRWGELYETCFALLFLYKGRAPVLFHKLRFLGSDGKPGQWDSHRRDIANLTAYVEKKKEQQFHWQIMELRAPLEELHQAPILFITAESLPRWMDDTPEAKAERKKLREFTDTGGTILFEASCGNPAVRKWFAEFAKAVWPEWPVKPIGPEHGVFTYPVPLKQRPEILGIDDGMRTFLFYALDDVSCPWRTRAMASREYLFQWGINLYAYATDGAPLRAKLSGAPKPTGRYAQPLKPGPRTAIKVARVQHGGNWAVNANYSALSALASRIKEKTGVALEVKETAGPPFNQAGVRAADLAGYQAAYITGSTGLALADTEKEALKTFADQGGFLWFEAAGGSAAFDKGLQQLARDMKWDLRMLPPDHPLMTGRMDPAAGHKLTGGMEFRTSLRMLRLNRQYADIFGVFAGDRMIGVYTPLDVVFSALSYEAFRCRGYKTEDAQAVAANLALYLSTLK